LASLIIIPGYPFGKRLFEPMPTYTFILLSFYRFIVLSFYRFIELLNEAVGWRHFVPYPTYLFYPFILLSFYRPSVFPSMPENPKKT